jgi:hypothetical protein
VFALALGYEDLVDHDDLTMAVLAGKCSVIPTGRIVRQIAISFASAGGKSLLPTSVARPTSASSAAWVPTRVRTAVAATSGDCGDQTVGRRQRRHRVVEAAWIGPELLGVRSGGVDGSRARGHCLNQLLRQRCLVLLKCGKKGKEHAPLWTAGGDGFGPQFGWILTMMQSCASAAKTPGGGPFFRQAMLRRRANERCDRH